MALRKVYRSLVYKDLDTYVMVDGIKTLVQFRGGSLQPRINGIFVSDDADIIAAMDKDRGNGTSFTCISVTGEPAKKAEPVKFAEPEEENEVTQITGVTTLQEVREFLLKNVEGLTPAKMPNIKSVMNLAAKNGYEFPDLKQ